MSGDTLIRLQRAEIFAHPAPAAIGVDEFAWKKRFRYGTLVVDLERRNPLDLLPTDTVEEFAHWLERHPPVNIIVLDRDAVFAQAGRQVVPNALQVADRFHLVKNVMDAFRTFALSSRWNAPHAPNPGPPAQPQPAQSHPPTPRKRLQCERVQALGRKGLTIRATARAIGMSRRTVRRYLDAPAPPVYRLAVLRTRKIDRYMDHLRLRWTQGVHNASRLYREIRERGYEGRLGMVRDAVRPWRAGPPQGCGGRARPTTRLAFRWRTSLSKDEAADLDQYLELNPRLSLAYRLKESFRTMLSSGHSADLAGWLEAAGKSGIAPFVQLASGMRRDQSAVSAALAVPWSTGQCEGQINRLKLLKRVGYGRAKPDLLRARVLHRMPPIESAQVQAA